MESRVGLAINQELCRVFTTDKVKHALFDMFPLKSLGPYGLPTLFYQCFWNFVGKSVCDCVLDFLNNQNLNPTLNFTHIVLIPKCKTTEKIFQFRPISLSNVIFKIALRLLLKDSSLI